VNSCKFIEIVIKKGGGGLFGAPAAGAAPASSGGGLFGAPAAAPASGGSVFYIQILRFSTLEL
jgi:hypothetical protein